MAVVKLLLLLGLLLLCELAAAASTTKKSHYEVLGIPRNANDRQIKKAYRSLAKKYHPDRHLDPAKKKKAEKLFMRVGRAYETLSDPEKRRIYDQVGDEGLDARMQQQQQQQQGFGGNQPPHFSFGGGGGGGASFDPFQLFAQMFGGNGGFPGSGRGQQQQQAGAGFFQNSPDVVEIDQNTASSQLGKSARAEDGRPWVVLFYAPWCGHCRQVKDEFARFGSKANGVVRVGAVNCDQEAGNTDLCKLYKVQTLPTIKLIMGKTQKAFGANAPRTASALNEFAVSNLPQSQIKIVASDKDAATFCNAQRKTKKRKCVVLQTSKPAPTSLYKSLALRDESRAVFVMVQNKDFAQPKLSVDGHAFEGKSFDMENLHSFIVGGGRDSRWSDL
jgi:curved DNA-binding protein CbpA